MPRDTDKDGNFIIRASSLPTWADCERRWAADNVSSLARRCTEERTQSKDPKRKNFGALFGRAGHLGTQSMLEDRLHGRDIDFWKGVDAAKENLTQEVLSEMMAKRQLHWDQVTKNLDVGLAQLESVLEKMLPFCESVEPLLIEAELEMDWAPGVILRGHPDLVDRDGDTVDLKFGARKANYIGQFGAYGWLLPNNKSEVYVRPRDFVLVHPPRSSWDKKAQYVKQKDIAIFRYDFDACIDSAYRQMEGIAAAVKKYESERKSDKRLWVFNTNPNSKYCTKTTCRAYGTSSCDQWIEDVSKEMGDEWEMN